MRAPKSLTIGIFIVRSESTELASPVSLPLTATLPEYACDPNCVTPLTRTNSSNCYR